LNELTFIRSILDLNIDPEDLYYFDFYLRELLIQKPANSLRSNGSPLENSKGYKLTYEVSFQEDGKETKFEITIITTREKIKPLQILVIKHDSKRKLKFFEDMIISRIKEAIHKTEKKPMKRFEFEALLSTGRYPIKSTIKFGKYTLSPKNERGTTGWLCKIRFHVNAINKDESHTVATIDSKHIAAFLSVIFTKLIRFQDFSEITENEPPIINYEEIDRPDLRPVKHPFSGELKIPSDFMELWGNLESLPTNIMSAFLSSCVCYQVGKQMNMTQMGIAYTLFVTAIEVISKQVVNRNKPGDRFIEFICKGIGRSDHEFRDRIGRYYGQRSNVLHNSGIGLGFMHIHGIRSFNTVSGTELWRLEIDANAALIGFLKNPEKF